MSEITPRSPVNQIVEAEAKQILPREARLQCQSMFAWDNVDKPGHEVSGTTIVTNSTVVDEYLFGGVSFELVITYEGLYKNNNVHVRDIWWDDDNFIASMEAPETWGEVVSWCRMVAAMHSPS